MSYNVSSVIDDFWRSEAQPKIVAKPGATKERSDYAVLCAVPRLTYSNFTLDMDVECADSFLFS